MNIGALVREISQQIPLDSWKSPASPTLAAPESTFFCHCDEFKTKNICDCTQRHKVVVESLKRDLNLAAKVGQSLLSQLSTMESRLASQEEEFKARQQELVTQNHELLQRNAELLDSTRESAHSIADSEARIAQLTARLSDANARCLRLNSYMSLAQSLEHQVAMLESMQESLQSELSSVKQDKSAAESRWRASEQLVHLVSRQYKQLSLDINKSTHPSFATEQISNLDDEPANWIADNTPEVPSLDDIDDTIDSSFDADIFLPTESTPLRSQKSMPANLAPRPHYHISSFKSLDELKAAAAAAAAATARPARPLQPQHSMQHLQPVPARVSTAMSRETLNSTRPILRRNFSHESVLSVMVEPQPLEKPAMATAELAKAALTDSQAHATKIGVKTNAREQLLGIKGLQASLDQRSAVRTETARWRFVPFRR